MTQERPAVNSSGLFVYVRLFKAVSILASGLLCLFKGEQDLLYGLSVGSQVRFPRLRSTNDSHHLSSSLPNLPISCHPTLHSPTTSCWLAGIGPTDGSELDVLSCNNGGAKYVFPIKTEVKGVLGIYIYK